MDQGVVKILKDLRQWYRGENVYMISCYIETIKEHTARIFATSFKLEAPKVILG